MTDNPNFPARDGTTPIYEACYRRDTEIVKILAPLTKNPNAPGPDGPPIYLAAKSGCDKIVQILAPLANNPNAPGPDGRTPLECAKYYAAIDNPMLQPSYRKIVKILQLSKSAKCMPGPSKMPSTKRGRKY